MLSLVLKLYALMSVVSLVLMVWCLVEAVSTDESRIRHLPKVWWILLILFFPLAGSIAWLAAGRPGSAASRAGSAPAFPEYDRPGRSAATDPAADEEFLRGVRERAEAQRRRYAQQRREQEQREQEERERRRLGGQDPEPSAEA
jgi:signal transduction histidine kinase